MARDLSKFQKRRLRELAALAHEEELQRAIKALDEQFDLWRKGELDPFELNEQIHQFHNGASRELYKMYAMGDPFFGIARAINIGILDRTLIEPEVMKLFESTLNYMNREADDEQE